MQFCAVLMVKNVIGSPESATFGAAVRLEAHRRYVTSMRNARLVCRPVGRRSCVLLQGVGVVKLRVMVW